ncbi:EF-P 5-aminopentanol modification-associated protein YfmF [Ammoniphilus sp. YIM 78166]|uniref:EF-P 5-aminopentanol modification-associated protein YfmF n=1 Tax=Ammoniphilus sp. YIM 78166 TaxID=1644106 RepID=UPI003512E0EC
MGQLLINSASINHMNLHVLATDKFKTTTIIVQMEQDLQEETVTKTALVPYVLKRGSAKYPTTQQLRQYLDSLFGAVFHTDVIKKGEKQIIQLQIELANEKYLSDAEPLLSKGIEFLGEVMTRPLVENGGFSPAFVKSEAELLKNKISGLVDDKIKYANQRVTEEMCKDEPYRLLSYGNLEELDQVDPVELYTYYMQLLSENPIDIYVVGDVEQEQVQAEITKHFTHDREQTKELVFNPVQKKNVEERTVIEHMEVGQGKLNIGCRTHTTLVDDDYEALLMYNGILGGFPHSKLFVNVREKASLAYYAVSRLESQKGILMLMSGVEIEKYEQAVSIMKEQLQQLKDGIISEQEMSQTKATLKNQLLEIQDNARTMVDFLYNGRLSGRVKSLEEMLEGIEKVTKEDIIQIANKIEIDTIYFLRDKEGTQG